MPINPLIALQGRPVQVPNAAGSRMALAHADLYEQQAEKARRDAEDEATIGQVLQQTGGQITDDTVKQVFSLNPRAGNALQQLRSRMASDKLALEKAQYEANEAKVRTAGQEQKNALDRAKAFSGVASAIQQQISGVQDPAQKLRILRSGIVESARQGLLTNEQALDFIEGASQWDDGIMAQLELIKNAPIEYEKQQAIKFAANEEARKVAGEARAQSKEAREVQEFNATLPGKVVNPQTGLTKAQQAQLDQGQQSPDIREYNFAVQRGEFKGSFPEWQAKMANLKAPRTTVNTSVNMPRELFKDESALRKELDDAPEVKSYSIVREQVGRARQAMQSLKDGGSANAADQVIVTVLNKVLDPASVVRESEYARTAEGQSLLNRLSGYASKLASGGAGLSGSERQVVMGMIERLGEASKQSYEQKTGYYRGLAKEYGFNPDRIVRPGGSAQSSEPRRLTPAIAAEYVAKAGGDAKKAREMAARDGYK